jgi:two-component system NtrC family sensor kinase
MKSLQRILLVVILTCLVFASNGQEHAKPERFEVNPIDSNQVNLLIEKADSYYFHKPDTCLVLVQQALVMAREINHTRGELRALNLAGEAFRVVGDYPQALEMQFKALDIVKKYRDKNQEGATLGFIGFIYADLKEYRQSLHYLLETKKIYGGGFPSSIWSTFNWSNIGYAYEGLNLLDSALYYQQMAQTTSAELPHKNLRILTLTRLGVVYSRLGRRDEALNCYHRALQNTYEIGDRTNLPKIQNRIAQFYMGQNQQDSSLYYAQLAYTNAGFAFQKAEILETSNLLVQLFRNKKMSDSVIYYLDKAAIVKDNLFGPEKVRQVQLFALQEQERQQNILQEQERYKNRSKILALGMMLGFALLIAFLLFRNIRHKQKINVVLQQQKEEIQETLVELKATQTQLIQSEKMASLGELTAGIAHEIQNPLNFVNNFSDVNRELVDELQQELKVGKINDAITLSNTLKENEEKINHYGKRADSIVKSMLQHSRTSTGQKELTDINALCLEYVRLSYHGLRAKNNSFGARFETQLDDSLPKINVVPQDIGRVILNIVNNAFYVVSEKSKQNISGYEPTVSVSTKKIKARPDDPLGRDKIEIKIKDNGNGVPEAIKEKIFLPFFTTKPPGQGTGLGLSLSYDVVKAQGGELNLETKEGEGSEFTITLPRI